MTKISGVVITFNEEANIARCIDSIAPVVDEIVVVDSFSTDQTKSICLSRGVRFIENSFSGHIEQKNFAVSQASNDMILSLDADEQLSEQLQRSISKLELDQSQAFVLSRLTNYCGSWVRHCGWYPDAKVRLWNRQFGKWGGENPHDKVIVENGISTTNLSGDILHYSFPTIQSHLETIAKFSSIAAEEAVRKNKRVYFIWHIVLNPMFTFFQKYVLQLGILDGYNGFIICSLSAYANLAKYSKIWTLKRRR